MKGYCEKEDGVELRRKLRLRNYGADTGFALLEMKQKQGAYQKKRSLRMAREDAACLCKRDYSVLLKYEDSFAAECYALMQAQCYIPRTVVDYKRRAFIAKENNIRVTIDSGITATESCFDIFSPALMLTAVLPPHLPIFRMNTGGQKIPGAAIFNEERIVVGYETGDNGEELVQVECSTVEEENVWHHAEDRASIDSHAMIRYRRNTSCAFGKHSYLIKLIEDGDPICSYMVRIGVHMNPQKTIDDFSAYTIRTVGRQWRPVTKRKVLFLGRYVIIGISNQVMERKCYGVKINKEWRFSHGQNSFVAKWPDVWFLGKGTDL